MNLTNQITEEHRTAAGMKVLVVEDDSFQRHLVKRVLKKYGTDYVVEAEDGRKALEALDHHTFDLILCDLDMPEMDGMEFVRHLGERRIKVSFAITSGWDAAVLGSVNSMCEAYGITPVGVISKPVTPEELASVLARAAEPTRQKTVTKHTPRFSLNEILDGVEKKEFEPFYQPKLDLLTGRIVGAEALARWVHPEHGVISPFEFIDQLEQSENIEALTFLMLEQSALSCRAWQDSGINLDISVNLSLTSLTDTTLADRIHDVVVSAGLDPANLTLEITETAAMTDVAPALENLARLRMRGFGLSIDDFGTGFSSMQQLSRIAFTELKIDRCFISTMHDRREARAIVKSSIDVATQLGIKSVAEGVESAEDLSTLKEIGCTLAQGYYIARPEAADRFLEICRENLA